MKKYIVIFAVCYLPMEAWAGQLQIHFVTLGEIALHGAAYLGTVVSVYSSQQLVTVKIRKSWSSERSRDGVSNIDISDASYDREFKIYGGIVWDNPNRSPVDHRVRGSVPLSEVKPGQDIVVVSSRGFEMIPADTHTVKKIELFFSPSELENYKKNAPEDTIYHDLKDADLSVPALEAMCARKLIATRAFLTLEPHKMFDLGWKLGDCLSAREFDEWMSAMIVDARSGQHRLKLIDLMRDSRHMGKTTPATQLALIKSLDLNDPDQQNALRWFVQDEVATLAVAPNPERTESSAALALSLAANRKDSASWEEYESLRKLISTLPEIKQIEFIKQIGILVMTSHRAKAAKERFDDGLMNFFIEQVTRNPSIEYLPELETIDLSYISKSSQNRVENRVAILDAGLAIAKKETSSSSAVFNALKRWADDEKIFNPEIILSLDDEKPSEKKKRWKSTLKNFKALKH